MTIQQLNGLYTSIKAKELSGRYITNSHIQFGLSSLPESSVSIIGYSEEERPIYGVTLGNGPKRILMWSQMHGNESTTTKSLFDCFNLFSQNITLTDLVLQQCTLFIIPILNPDGAFRYTRFNANNIDLNRDAQQQSQKESQVLRQIYDDFKPDYCFNLHGQRTIFGAGESGKAATLSFLSPSQDDKRSHSPNRKVAMALISSISAYLSELVPNGIGRYDDDFNINCVGDTFQSLGTPTVLYEAGHYPGDYDREEVRRLVFLALIKGLETISNGIDSTLSESYHNIPENSKSYRDVAIVNAVLSKEDESKFTLIIQFKELLTNGEIEFLPVVESISKSTSLKFHKVINAHGKLVRSIDNSEIKEGYENDFVLINNKKTALKA